MRIKAKKKGLLLCEAIEEKQNSRVQKWTKLGRWIFLLGPTNSMVQ